MSEKTLMEGIHGTWFYHFSNNGRTAVCGETRVMSSKAPESTWGFRGNAKERYCSKCAEVRAREATKDE